MTRAGYEADLFLSYHGDDREAVHSVQQLLEARGISTFLDRDNLVRGLPWPQALEQALRSCRAVAVFLGREIGAWQKREMWFALDRQASVEKQGDSFPVVPILLPGADPGTGFLFLNTWVDLRQDLAAPGEVDALASAMAATTTQRQSRPNDTGVCPYRALNAFREEDAAFFCGRDALSDELQKKVLASRLVAVVGASGCGKSSVVMAGLVPRLRSQRPPGVTWDVVSCSPGKEPFRRLARGLVGWLEPALPASDLVVKAEALGDKLERGEIRAAAFIEEGLHNSGADRLLLVVDQFEELFTQARAELRKPFASALLATLDTCPVVPVLTLRADFYGLAIDLDPRLSDLMQAAVLNVRRLRREELRIAIEKPAHLVGLRFDPPLLVEKLLDDVGEEPGNLPLLEYALFELWLKRQDGTLTQGAYKGVTSAIAARAEAEFAKLSLSDQEVARRLLTRLVRTSTTSVGLENTRQRVLLADLGDAARRVAGEFCDKDVRLLVTADDESGRETVEVAHEALIPAWDRLRKWLADDTELRFWRQRLEPSLEYWKEDPTSLLSGLALSEAQKWLEEHEADLVPKEIQFIRASIRERDRKAAEEVALREQQLQFARNLAGEAQGRQRAEAQRALEAEKRLRAEQQARGRRRVILVLAAIVAVAGVFAWRKAIEATDRAQRLTVAARELDIRARRLRASAILAAAGRASDPAVAVLLAAELNSEPEPPDGLATLQRIDQQAAPTTVLRGHEKEVLDAAFSADGTRVVTASEDGTARVWRADGSGEPVVLRGHEKEVRDAAFSADGTRVVTASNDGTARVWRADGSGEAVVLRGVVRGIYHAAFSVDGTHVVTACVDGTARVWRADGSGEPVVLRGHGGPVFDAAFSADGTRVVTASGDGTARVWRTDGSGEPVVLPQNPLHQVYHAAFSVDGTHVVTACQDGTARVWRADGSGEPVVLRHEGPVSDAAFSADGTHVLTASEDGTARVWRADGSGEAVMLRGDKAGVGHAEFSVDGTHVVTACDDSTAWVWRADGSGEPVVLRGHEAAVYRAAFSADGTRVVTASEDATARVWRADGSGEPVVLRGHEEAVLDAAFSADGTRVVTASRDRTARVWRADGSGEPVVLRGHESEVSHAAFSADGTRVVTASGDAARVWRADGSGEPVVLRGHDLVNDAEFSADGTRVVTASGDRTARVWRADGSGEPVVLRHEGGVFDAEFSADGTRVVTASGDATARVWRADGSGEPVVLRGHEKGKVLHAAFSADGTRVVTASEDATARVWRADGSGEPVVLRGHEGPVFNAAFSADGTRVVTASEDGTARVWRVDWSSLIAYATQASTACLTAEQRQQLLADTAEGARNHSVACERKYGRSGNVGTGAAAQAPE